MRADSLQYSALQICSACDAEMASGNGATVFTGISTDSRDIKDGDLFVPLKGDNFNGFDYVIPALQAGAGGSLIDSGFSQELSNDISDRVLIRVQDTLRSLTDLASTHRKLFPIPLVAVTGSSGKTTVREMIASILSRKYRTLATKGNLNNLIGLPMTILTISPECEAAVVEAGINRIGEMDMLARAAAPNVGVISTIGPVHLEGLKNIATVASEKFRLVMAASDTGVIPFGVPELEALRERFSGKLFTFGIDRGDFRASNISMGDRIRFLMESPWGSREITILHPGKHNIANALAASAACLSIGLSLDDVATALVETAPPAWRMEFVQFGADRILIRDYYNANPQSMRAALETLADINGNHSKIAILGDMKELGAESYSLHHDIGRLAASLKIDRLIFIGESGRAFADGFFYAKGASGVLSLFDDRDSAWEVIRSEIGAYDRILVKASRAMKMELLAGRILEEI